MSGDITFTDAIGEPLIKKWNIETKTGYGGREKIKKGEGAVIRKIQSRWDILDCIDSKQKEPILEQMWKQCKRDAELSNRIPVLIFRRNNRTPCIMISTSYEMKLQEYFGSINHSSIRIELFDRCTIMNLKDFTLWIPDIRAALEYIS